MNIRLIIPLWQGGADLPCDCLPINPQPYLSAIADITGGFTSWHGTGGWIDASGSLVVEPITIVECSIADCTDTFGKANCFRSLAQRIAQDLGQVCVYLAIDGK
jgi:hypothetical protein